jgi:Tfp pilus assembly protein PilF
VLLALGARKSATRAAIWRSNDTFFGQIVEDAPLSYRAQHIHGMWLFGQGRRAEGEQHVRAAIAMFPYDAGPYTDLADQYRFAGLCAPARELYRRAIELGRLSDRARIGLVICLLHDAQYADAAAEARVGASAATFQAAQFERLAAIADSAIAVTSPLRQSGVGRRGSR